MADDRHYVPGDWYRICDRTGFKVRAGKTRKEWTGRIVRESSWEQRHSQDFVRGVPDPQAVPDPRPRQTDVFLGPLETTLTAAAAAGASVLSVASSTRMLVGDTLNIMLDDGTIYRPTISIISSSISITVNPVLPSKASSGNRVLDVSAYSAPSIG